MLKTEKYCFYLEIYNEVYQKFVINSIKYNKIFLL